LKRQGKGLVYQTVGRQESERITSVNEAVPPSPGGLNSERSQGLADSASDVVAVLDHKKIRRFVGQADNLVPILPQVGNLHRLESTPRPLQQECGRHAPT